MFGRNIYLACAICSKEVVIMITGTTPNIGVLCPSCKDEPSKLIDSLSKTEKELADQRLLLQKEKDKVYLVVERLGRWKDLIKTFIVK
jgi:hypothetical protein